MKMTTLLSEGYRLVAFLVLAGASFLGCANTATDGAGSETHFVCSKDADCTGHGGPCVFSERDGSMTGECRIAAGGAASTGGVSGTGGIVGTGGTGRVTSTGGTSGTGGTPPSGCPTGLAGPNLVEIPAPQGGTYCMDATEVTSGQYAQFLTAKGADGGTDVSGQDTWCTWNTTYIPSNKVGPSSTDWPRPGMDAYPVVNVDWCDAYAYCKWAGKHLCGKIGGGSNAYADYADKTKSEWFNACSNGGTQTYPYGNTYSGSACVGPDYDGVSGSGASDVVRPVGSATQCEGGYAGLFDLSGNVWEWEDSCNGTTGTNDACRPRGGSWRGAPQFAPVEADYLACGFDYFGAYSDVSRDSRYDNNGFRCCGTSL